MLKFPLAVAGSLLAGVALVGPAPGIFKAPGFWLRCNGVPCAPGHPEHIIATGEQPDSTLMEILPTDTAVYLFNTTLTFIG